MVKILGCNCKLHPVHSNYLTTPSGVLFHNFSLEQIPGGQEPKSQCGKLCDPGGQHHRKKVVNITGTGGQDESEYTQSPFRMFNFLLLITIYTLSDVDVGQRSLYDISFKYFLEMSPEEEVIGPIL